MQNETAAPAAIEAPLAPLANSGANANGHRPVPSYRAAIEFLANNLEGEQRENLEAELATRAISASFGFPAEKVASDIFKYRSRGMKVSNLEAEVERYNQLAAEALSRGDSEAAFGFLRAAKRAKRGRG